MTTRALRMVFDRGVVFMPAGGRVLLAFHDDDTEPLDLTADLPLLLGAGLVLLAEPSASGGPCPDIAPEGTSTAADRDDSMMVDVATLEFPDRMRVYHEGRRLSTDEVGAAVQATVRSAVRAAIRADAS